MILFIRHTGVDDKGRNSYRGVFILSDDTKVKYNAMGTEYVMQGGNIYEISKEGEIGRAVCEENHFVHTNEKVICYHKVQILPKAPLEDIAILDIDLLRNFSYCLGELIDLYYTYKRLYDDFNYSDIQSNPDWLVSKIRVLQKKGIDEVCTYLRHEKEYHNIKLQETVDNLIQLFENLSRGHEYKIYQRENTCMYNVTAESVIENGLKGEDRIYVVTLIRCKDEYTKDLEPVYSLKSLIEVLNNIEDGYELQQVKPWLIRGVTMQIHCRNCKFFDKGKCLNKLPLGMETEKTGVKYSEDGLLVEALREGLDIEEIAKKVMGVLKDNNMLKAKANVKALDLNGVDESIYEMVDEALYSSISNYFDEVSTYNFTIDDPDSFYCNQWE